MEERSDEELMMAVREGFDQAFAVLVDRYQKPLVHFFYKISWDRSRAEDCAQEVFCRIYAARRDYEPSAHFTTYLFRVARNLSIDQFRREGRRPRELSLEGVWAGDDDEERTTMREVVADGRPSPSESVRKQEVLREVRRAIDNLPSDQRIVFQLSEDQGLKYKQISDILDIPIGTVKSRMHAAMLKLRESLRARVSEP